MFVSTASLTRPRAALGTRLFGLLAATLLLLGLAAPAALADTTAPPVPESPAAPAVPGSVGGVPENAATWSISLPDNEHGTDRPNFSYSADPGATITDGLTVSNYGSAPLTLAVYAADGFLTDTGSIDLLKAGVPSVALGSWVTAESATITLQPDEVVTVPFTIAIPANATPGDYAAGVVTTLTTGADGGMAVDRRLGSRMMLRVNGALSPALAVTDLTVTPEGTFWPWLSGSSTVTFTVTNTGNTRLASGARAEISGPGGLLATAADVELPELLPGSSAARTVTVDGVWPAFRLGASVIASGTVVGADEGSAPVTVSAGAESSFWQIPWGLLILLIVIAALGWWRLAVRRRRKRGAEASVQEAVRTALAEHGIQTPVGDRS